MPEAKRIVVCRRVSDGHTSGSKPGYFCKECGVEVAATPAGQKFIAEGAPALCNPCGFSFAERMQKLDLLAGVEMTPEAEAQLEKRRKAAQG